MSLSKSENWGRHLASVLHNPVYGRKVVILIAILPAIALGGFLDDTPMSYGGKVRQVMDGSTFKIAQHTIRLSGIVVPSLPDPRADAATVHLRALILDQKVKCKRRPNSPTAKRVVAYCSLGKRDLGKEMILSGFAIECPRYSFGRYRGAERLAIAKGHSLRDTLHLPGYCRVS
ncbi:MAG: thermonuclease family protein [Pseudomonadota bacterium]